MAGQDGDVSQFETRRERMSRWKQYKFQKVAEKRDQGEGWSKKAGGRRWKKHRRGGDTSEETEEEFTGMKKRWHNRHSSRFAAGGYKKEDRLQKVCERLSDTAPTKKNPFIKRRSQFTEEVQEEHADLWQQTREDLQFCCNILDEEEKMDCFRDTHSRRMSEKMCSAEDQDFKRGELPEKIKAAKEKCCELEGTEQLDCLKTTLRLMKHIKRQRKNTPVSEEQRVEDICMRVSKRPVAKHLMKKEMPIVQKRRWMSIFTSRRLQMQECCTLDKEEHPACLADVKEQRLDRVCKGEEPMSPPWSMRSDETDEVVEECCVLDDEERYACFEEKLPCHGRHKQKQHRPHHNHHHRGPHRSSEKEETEMVEAESLTDEESAEPFNRKRAMNQGKRKMVTKASADKRKQKRQCCKSGRKAGNQIDGEVSKWKTCQNEAKGFIVDRASVEESSGVMCKMSFRKCCVTVAIRNAGEEAVEEAEMEEIKEEALLEELI